MVLQTAGGVLTQRYLWSDQIDQLIAVETVVAPTVYWALTDHLGTVRDLITYNDTTETTELVKHRVFDSFGNVISDDAPSIILAFGYTGRWFDITTGLQWNLNRWYDPKLGQSVSEDPIEFQAGDGNLRRYVKHSVLNAIDPSGLVEVKTSGVKITSTVKARVIIYRYKTDNSMDDTQKIACKESETIVDFKLTNRQINVAIALEQKDTVQSGLQQLLQTIGNAKIHTLTIYGHGGNSGPGNHIDIGGGILLTPADLLVLASNFDNTSRGGFLQLGACHTGIAYTYKDNADTYGTPSTDLYGNFRQTIANITRMEVRGANGRCWEGEVQSGNMRWMEVIPRVADQKVEYDPSAYTITRPRPKPPEIGIGPRNGPVFYP